MSKATDSLLDFNDFENFGEAQETPVKAPKRVENDEATSVESSKVGLFQIEFYQQFFNIDTPDVVERIVSSVVPKRAPSSYLKTHLVVNPDLYGPFWVTVTLIFTIGISGNLARFFQHDHSSDFRYHYNFHMIASASTAIILYVCVVPVAVWGVLKWSVNTQSEDNLDLESAPYVPSLLSIICLYGYSLAVYVPVSILWTIQISALQWLLVLGATFLSGSVLINILMPSLKASKYSYFIIIGIAAAHFLLAAGFMLKFFHNSSPEVAGEVVHHVKDRATQLAVNATQ